MMYKKQVTQGSGSGTPISRIPGKAAVVNRSEATDISKDLMWSMHNVQLSSPIRRDFGLRTTISLGLENLIWNPANCTFWRFIGYLTNGAFVISEEAIASFSPPEVALLFKRKTIDSILS